MKLEVLVTTMHQTGIEKYSQMNIQTDVVIANQCGENSYFETIVNDNIIKLVSTATIGLSRNRNIALAHSNQRVDFILFSDDDLVFNDGYADLVIKEFEAHPRADAIKFNLHDLSSTRKLGMKYIQKFEKATKRNMMASGICGLVIRRSSLEKSNLHFREDFGAGTDIYSGEDSIFLIEMFRKKVQLYRSPIDIAGIDQSESTWFKGIDRKYFEVKGIVIKSLYPHLCYLLIIRSAYRAYRRGDSGMSFFQILSYYYSGIKKR